MITEEGKQNMIGYIKEIDRSMRELDPPFRARLEEYWNEAKESMMIKYNIFESEVSNEDQKT